MLCEIYCDKFVSDGVERPPIRFNDGLNVVLGDNSGANSIGKSTFLMIIDFVFGGNDYIEKYADGIDQVGLHKICFTFRFENVLYKFFRSTATPTIVSKCGLDYHEEETVSIDEYRQWLKIKYSLAENKLTFREATSNFFRIYKRENYDEQYPLRSFAMESETNSILRALKLFERFETHGDLKDAADSAEKEFRVFNSSIRQGYVDAVSDKRDLQRTKRRIDEIKMQLSEYSSEVRLSKYSEEKAIQAAATQSALRNLRLQYSRLQIISSQLKDDSAINCEVGQNELACLKTFFPEANFATLAEIEMFHSKLTAILADEIATQKTALESKMDILRQKIAGLERFLSAIDVPLDLPKAVLDEYASLKMKQKELEMVCSNYERKQTLSEARKATKAAYDNAVLSDFAYISSSVTAKMAELNSKVYSDNRTSPIFQIVNSKQYKFQTERDDGTGNCFKGLVLFDLSILAMTKLPVLIHDSVVLKQIGDDPIEKILELYCNAGKQVFISLDKASSYSEKTQHILETNSVLSLGAGSRALFGRYWGHVK